MILGFLVLLASQQPAFGVTGLRVEYLTNPLGIDAPHPRLSWRIASTERNTVQAAYQVQVTKEGKVIWDSGRTESDASVFVPYAGPALGGGDAVSIVAAAELLTVWIEEMDHAAETAAIAVR